MLLNHLLELRRRALIILIVFLAQFLFFFIFASDLLHVLTLPLLKILPAQDSLIATQLTSPFFIPIKLAADAAMLGTAPVLLIHLWRFAAPGLYRRERKGLKFIISISLLLFGTGMLFCFYIVLPFMMQFLIHIIPQDVRLMPDIGSTLDFITRMLLIFGMCFQVPLLCLFLLQLGVLDVSFLKKVRPYVIVAAFIVGMLLTPPDVLSQILLAVPLCLLYEIGIFLGSCLEKSKLSN